MGLSLFKRFIRKKRLKFFDVKVVDDELIVADREAAAES
jgi:hypothetical protein